MEKPTDLIGPMWRAGERIADIVKRTGLSRNQVMGYAGRHRDECPKRPRPERIVVGTRQGPSDDELRKAIERDALAARDVGRQYGVSATTVLDRMRELNIAPAHQGAPRRDSRPKSKKFEVTPIPRVRTCQWVDKVGKEWVYCGNPVEKAGASYCVECAEKVYEKRR